MAGLNHQVRGELDHSQGLRAAQNARSFSDHSDQDEKPDLNQERRAHNRDRKEHVARRKRIHECLASCEAPGSKSFRLENVSVPNADDARYERASEAA